MNYPVLLLLLVVAIGIVLVKIFATKYTISASGFKSLLSGMNDARLTEVTTRGPNRVILKYKIYPIDMISCYDKKGNAVLLKNSPALEIAFTDHDNKKTIFYFDTLRINGNIVTGSQSRFINNTHKSVDINTVSKIELQSIKKGFKYLSKNQQ